MNETPPVLALRGLSKKFGALVALNDVALTVEPGEVHCVLGENGAGKSTLCNVIFGVHQRDSGEILLDGRSFRPSRPADSLTAGETGLNSSPRENWPPVAIPFFTFRIMVGCGLAMLGLAWFGTYLSFRHRLAYNRPMVWLTFLSFPLPFIAIVTGWFTAEVGRQPWVVFGVLRTADAMTPFLTTRQAIISLVIFCAVYAFIFLFGTFYIYRLIRNGPVRKPFEVPHLVVPNRPMSLPDDEPILEPDHAGAGE